MNHNKNWQPTLLSLYRLQNSAMSTTQKQWVEITHRFWTVTNMHNWTYRMNFQNESEQWTNSCHIHNTEQSSRHSWCECHSLGRAKTKQYQREIRKILCLLSNSCLFQCNMKVGHSRFKSGYEQTSGHGTNFCITVGSLLDCVYLCISKMILFIYLSTNP